MGLKKYEIITVGSDKRVRALRSWQVGDRYVNIGDVGGIVYDGKTLSQDGACWLFRGNFGFPGARIGGDSIVDVGEAALSATGAPNVDILGSSVVVGSKLSFTSDQTAADVVTLTAADFEQGGLVFSGGANWETWKVPRASNIRLKAPIFMGGAATTLKIEVPGYVVQAFVMDRDGIGTFAKAPVITGEGATLEVPAGQYFTVMLAKDPSAAIVPADATAAQIKFTGTYETKLVVVDSRVEINPATSTATAVIKPGGTYTFASGAKYPEAVIRNSRVSMMVHATAGRSFRLMGQIIGSTATLDATAGDLSVSGQYGNVKNLTASGVLTSDLGLKIYNSIQATDCDNFKIDSTVISPRGFNAAISANMPFIFQGCNVPGGKFYHHAQIANTYKNIDFALASVDLGKTFSTDGTLGSSEVEGMYRAVFNGAPGPLIESYASVKDLVVSQNQKMYGTTIYKDAYFNGAFDIQGTNVFGNKVRSHPLAQVLNVQPRVVQGNFNATAVGGTISAVVTTPLFVSTPVPFRINSAKGLTINNLPAGCVALMFMTDANNVITRLQSTTVANTDLMAAGLADVKVFIRFGKSDRSPITPEDLAGVTVTVYNGCKIVNTGKAAIPMNGNIRVEDNATLINVTVTGTGYFGGNAVASGLRIGGAVFMSDNTSFVKTEGSTAIRDLKMTENAYAVTGDFSLNGRIHLSDNARFIPGSAELFEGDLIMKDNAVVSGNAAVIISGVVTMKDNARVSGETVELSAYGDITLCGSYNQTVNKTWIGKRVIDSQNAPTYDDNVKTKYDF